MRRLEKKYKEEQAERELAESFAEACRIRAVCPLPPTTTQAQSVEGTEATIKRAEQDLAAVLAVAKKSGNLKGTCQKEIKTAVDSLKGSIEYLAQRSLNVETQRLEREVSILKAENSSLRQELNELKNQVLALKSNKRERRAREEQRRNSRRLNVSSSSSRSRSSRATTKNAEDSPPPGPIHSPTPEGKTTSSPRHRATPTPAVQEPSIATAPEEFARKLMEQVGLMMSARLEALENRLLPAPLIRPPLGKKGNPPNPNLPHTAGNTVCSKATTPKVQPGGDNKGATSMKMAPTITNKKKTANNTSITTLQPPANTWVEVVSKGQKKKSKKATIPGITTSAKETRSTGRKTSDEQRGSKKGNKTASKSSPLTNATRKKTTTPKAPKPPKTAAVVLTLSPEATAAGITYAEILTTAKTKIKLADLNIEHIKCRNTIAGARILEISGEDKGLKADLLAEKLKSTLADEDVRVTRPTKCAEIRLIGLDDTATTTEVAEALANQSDCTSHEIRVGDIRETPAGTRITWARCPVSAANKVASMGRIKIGWTLVRAQLLRPRPLQCYRCFEQGHTKQRCTAEVDRSNCCYRCGKSGHRAAQCEGEAHCLVCAAAGRPAGHRCGGQACKPLPRKKKTREEKKEGPTITGKNKTPTIVAKSKDGEQSTSPTPYAEIDTGTENPPTTQISHQQRQHLQQKVPPEGAMETGA